MLVDAERPVIYAGQGVHYAKAWAELKELAELLEAPVTTSLEGKSAFPENHPLSLGSGGARDPGAGAPLLQRRRRHLRHRLQLHAHQLRHPVPAAARPIIHATLDPTDINKDVPAEPRAGRRRQAHAARR